VAGWFGRQPVLDFVDWTEFERRVGSEHATTTRDHIERSIAASITRARSVLDYAPRYSSLEALRGSLRWMVERGVADVGGQRF
jgi:nucleoside-diphosphate-sugar epimerase